LRALDACAIIAQRQHPDAATDTEEEGAALARLRSVGFFWLAWLGGLALLALLAALASVYSYFPADLRIAHWIQRDGGILLWGGAAAFLRYLGNLPSNLIWLLATAALLLARRYPEGFLVFSSIVPRVAQALLKEAVERPRPTPDLVRVSEHPSSFSFPSGHVVTALALFGLLFFVVPAVVRRPLLRLALQGFCLFVVLGMGPASVYTGAHWSSDVLGSYVLGVLYLALVLRYYRRWRPAGEAPTRSRGRVG
jgi:membrane-associated phospholipid phosphatase